MLRVRYKATGLMLAVILCASFASASIVKVDNGVFDIKNIAATSIENQVPAIKPVVFNSDLKTTIAPASVIASAKVPIERIRSLDNSNQGIYAKQSKNDAFNYVEIVYRS